MSGGVLRVDGARIDVAPGETALEALERSGADVPSGCRAGSCTKCMLRTDGDPPAGSQRGLRPTLRAQGYFLSCQARPSGELRILSASGPPVRRTVVESTELLAPDVARLRLRLPDGLVYRPGQYIDVVDADGAERSYSIASLPDSGLLELHVRRVPGGRVSAWLHSLRAGDPIRVRGPFGQCFYVTDDARRKLLLVGAGTGLAPLFGIARDALDQGHVGPIDLVHGGLDPTRLYLGDELDELARSAPQLRVHRCVLRGATGRELEGPIDEIAVRLAGPIAEARAFLCGDGAIVRTLQRSLFLAGISSDEILADPFLPSGT